jgi:predicted outer membrane protein
MKAKLLLAAAFLTLTAAPAFAASKGEPGMALPKLHAINLNEIESGDIVARRGCDPEVRALARLISDDHKRLDADLQETARLMIVPLNEVRVDAYEYHNFQKQMRDLKNLRRMNTCAMDLAFLKSMRDGHIFAGSLVDQAMNDPASAPIRPVLENTAATIPVHYNGSVRLLEKLGASETALAR